MKHLIFIVLLVAFTGCATGTHRQNHPALAIYAATVSRELPRELSRELSRETTAPPEARKFTPAPRRRLFRR